MSVPARTLSARAGDTFIDWKKTPPAGQWVKIRNILWDAGYEIVPRSDSKTGKPPAQGSGKPGVGMSGPDDVLTVGKDPFERTWTKEVHQLSKGPELPYPSQHATTEDYIAAYRDSENVWVSRAKLLLYEMNTRLVRPRGRHER